MTLVEEYYEINETEEVSILWKVVQIGLYAAAAGFGIWCGFTLAVLRLKFSDRCYLFINASEFEKKDLSNESWGNDIPCDIFQFSMISSFIVAIIWGALYLMCGKGGKAPVGLPQPWRIVWPSFVFNLLYFVFIIINVSGIQKGTDIFCARKRFQIFPSPLVDSCDTVKRVIKTDVYMILVQIEIVVKTSWGCAIAWFLLIAISLLRIVLGVDFRIYKICVFRIDDTIQNKQEEVLKITNYEDPLKINYDQDEEEFHKQEFTLDDLEKGTKKKMKFDKRLMRQHLHTAPYNPNTVFYKTADLRMLNREKKRVTPSEALDKAFRKTSTTQRFGLRKSAAIQSDAEALEKFQLPTLLYQFYHHLPKETDDDEARSSSSSSSSLKLDSDDRWNESESGSEVLVNESNHSLKLKKQV